MKAIRLVTTPVYVALMYVVLVSSAAAQDDGSDGAGGGVKLVNPLKADNITDLLLAILEIILIFAIPIIVFFIMYAGFLFVTAQGEPGKISQARSAFTWAVVGGVIVLGSKLLVDVIQATVNSI